MAAFDANLGSTSSANSGSVTLTLTTSAAAAANTRIVVPISFWNSAGIALITGVTVGGTAATRDLRVTNANGNDNFDIWSVPKTAGLASSSAIIATAAAAMNGGYLMGAVSLSSVDMTVGGGVAGTGSSNSQTGTNWSSGTASASGGIAVGGAGNETALTSETATASTGTLLHHLWNTTAQQGFATAYVVGTSVAGTFANTSTATTGGIVAYTDSAVAPLLRTFNAIPFM